MGHYKYSYKQSNAKTNISKSSIVHLMLRLVILSTICIFLVELLFVTLLLKRVLIEIIRCIEAFCGAMACLCVYLHFSANHGAYDCVCRCCHGCCLRFCLRCIAVRFKNTNHVIGDWGQRYTVDENDENFNTLEMNYICVDGKYVICN